MFEKPAYKTLSQCDGNADADADMDTDLDVDDRVTTIALLVLHTG